MTLNYDFGEDYPYIYVVETSDLKKAIIKMLCEGAKRVQGKLYEENGAYQMAMYVVHSLDILDRLSEVFEDYLYEYFYDKALAQYEEQTENAKEEDDWHGTMHDVRGI